MRRRILLDRLPNQGPQTYEVRMCSAEKPLYTVVFFSTADLSAYLFEHAGAHVAVEVGYRSWGDSLLMHLADQFNYKGA